MKTAVLNLKTMPKRTIFISGLRPLDLAVYIHLLSDLEAKFVSEIKLQ